MNYDGEFLKEVHHNDIKDDMAAIGFKPHHSPQHLSADEDDFLRLREYAYQKRGEYTIDGHHRQLRAAHRYHPRFQDITHPAVVPGAVVIAHKGLCSRCKTLIDIIAEGKDLLCHAHGSHCQLAVGHSKVIVYDICRGGQEGLKRGRYADPEYLRNYGDARADICLAGYEQSFAAGV